MGLKLKFKIRLLLCKLILPIFHGDALTALVINIKTRQQYQLKITTDSNSQY